MKILKLNLWNETFKNIKNPKENFKILQNKMKSLKYNRPKVIFNHFAILFCCYSKQFFNLHVVLTWVTFEELVFCS